MLDLIEVHPGFVTQKALIAPKFDFIRDFSAKEVNIAF